MYTLVSVQMYFICLQDTNRIGHNSSYSYVFSCIGSVIVINPTFNNISGRSWRSVLLVEETGVPGENHRPVVSHWQTLSYNVVSSLDYKISNIIKKKYRFELPIDMYIALHFNYQTNLGLNYLIKDYISPGIHQMKSLLFVTRVTRIVGGHNDNE
jgi:hypothetical protein